MVIRYQMLKNNKNKVPLCSQVQLGTASAYRVEYFQSESWQPTQVHLQRRGRTKPAGHPVPTRHPSSTQKERAPCLPDHKWESRLPKWGTKLSDAGTLRAGETDPGDPAGAAAGCEQKIGAGGISEDKMDLRVLGDLLLEAIPGIPLSPGLFVMFFSNHQSVGR